MASVGGGFVHAVCFAAAVFIAAQAGRPVLERVPQLQATARMANFGALGCGAGTLKLVTSRGVVTASTALDPVHVFGGTVRTADLLALLKSRAESNRTGRPGPMSGEVGDLCYVCLSALAVSREPDAVPVLAELLADADDAVRGWAAIALFRLGDADDKLRPEIRKARFHKAALASADSRGERPPPWLQLGK